MPIIRISHSSCRSRDVIGSGHDGMQRQWPVDACHRLGIIFQIISRCRYSIWHQQKKHISMHHLVQAYGDLPRHQNQIPKKFLELRVGQPFLPTAGLHTQSSTAIIEPIEVRGSVITDQQEVSDTRG